MPNRGESATAHRVAVLERYVRCIERLCLDLYRGGSPHANALSALADIGRSVDLARREADSHA